MEEMRRRGYNPDSIWENPDWRGSTLGEQVGFADKNLVNDLWMNINQMGKIIYPEHNDDYLQECIDNLKGKGIEIRLD
jgi:uncharacterized protein (TIGR02328 family)